MKYLITLMVETSMVPESYKAIHYTGDRSPENWFKLPMNFVNAVQVAEVNKFKRYDNITAEEIGINHMGAWAIVFFTPDHEYKSSFTFINSDSL